MNLRMTWLLALAAMAVSAGLMAQPPATAVTRAPGLAAAPVIARPTPWRVVYTNRTGRPILHDIAALSSTDIWAIGDRRSGPFTVHWNGRRWSTAKIPHAAGFIPLSISAPSARDVWALGFRLRSGLPEAFRWNGSSWQVVALPANGSDLGVVFSP